MPTYVYRFVDTGETIEVQQSFTDDTLTEIAHPDSGEVLAVKKVFQPVGVTFRGSGFFKTDSRSAASSSTGGAKTGSGDAATSGAGDSTSGTSGDSGSSSKASTTSSPPAGTGSSTAD